MNPLIIHNLKAGWRNILKYKVQNIVSVLCLAVGIVLFAFVIYAEKMFWQNKPFTFQDEPVRISYSLREEGYNALCHLPSVKSTYFIQSLDSGCTTSITKRINSQQTTTTTCYGEPTYYVSPDFFKDFSYLSSTTGHSLSEIKEGTVFISKGLLGHDPATLDDVKVTLIGKKLHVSDVIFSPFSNSFHDAIFIVKSHPVKEKPGVDPTFPYVGVYLKDGCTEDQLMEDMSKSKYDFSGVSIDSTGGVFFFLFVVLAFFFIGSSVLVVGLAGYLKMQLQLFGLRSREMALRRCSGAKPYQLFLLLCSEFFVILLITTIIAIPLSNAIYNMLVHSFGDQTIIFYMPIVYRIEIAIALFTLLAAIIIAWLRVRKMLNTPLTTTISRSYGQNIIWNKVIQTVQFFASTAIILGITWICIDFPEMQKFSEYGMPADEDYYRRILEYNGAWELQTNNNGKNGFFNEVKKLPSVEKSAWYYRWRYNSEINDTLGNAKSEESTVYVTDPEAFDIYKLTINKLEVNNKPVKQKFHPCPVYVKADDQKNLLQKLHIKYKVPQKTYTLPDSDKYVLAGYTDGFPEDMNRHPEPGTPSPRYLVRDMMRDTPNYKLNYEQHHLLLLPKDGDTTSLCRDIVPLCRKFRPYYTEAQLRPVSVFRRIFGQYDIERQMRRSVVNILAILGIVSILSTVLTIYSSISLETRGRQKEVAIRKVNGAKTRDIVLLFGRYYIHALVVSFSIILAIGLPITLYLISEKYHDPDFIDGLLDFLSVYLISILIISLVTLLTVWQKIYKIAHINPALLIKKE